MSTPCYLPAYDISVSCRRQQALKQLRKVADFYQDSVFDARLRPQERQHLLRQLQHYLAPGDSLFCVRLGPNCQSWQLGCGLEPCTALGLVIS